MNYTELAIQLIDMRACAPQIKMERAMSQIARGEILALNYLAANGNRAYPKDMSRALMLTTARVAAMLKSLERQDMITRTPDSADNRQVIVSLTEKGISLVEERRTAMIHSVAKMLEALGEEDAEAYVRIQAKLIELGDIWR
ncbi:MarR family winged helix-turn-helix transcriptional regulator [Ihubacter sp. mB4P-1]|uniref:MarR family winged helix-turn-helix transcriptional regulator n=1 Tax=Ihubacter sp. mB4P-1 TaxID=3242370 RepID=UPI003C7A4FAE